MPASAHASNAQIRSTLTGRDAGTAAAWAAPDAVAAVTEADRLLWPLEQGTQLGLDGLDSVFGTPGFKGLRDYGIHERAIASVSWRTCMARRAVTADGRAHVVCHEDDPVEVVVHFKQFSAAHAASSHGCQFLELPARTLRIFGTGELPFDHLRDAQFDDLLSLDAQPTFIEALTGDERAADLRTIMRDLRERREQAEQEEAARPPLQFAVRAVRMTPRVKLRCALALTRASTETRELFAASLAYPANIDLVEGGYIRPDGAFSERGIKAATGSVGARVVQGYLDAIAERDAT